jgi:uncharacterized membrane protein
MVTRLNLLLLMVVAFLPFPTQLVAQAINSNNDAERTAVLVYGATLLTISMLVTMIIRYAGARSELIEEEGREEVMELAAGASPRLGFYAIVLALAFVSPKVAAFGFLALRFWRSFASRDWPGRDRQVKESTLDLRSRPRLLSIRGRAVR